MLHLASQSPRRRDLLARLGLPFGRVDVDVPEVRDAGESGSDYVLRVAADKARAGLQALGDAGGVVVLGADTEVVLDGVVFGKPRDDADAVRMLQALSGRTHEVISAVVLTAADRQAHSIIITEVTFDVLDADTIAAYVASGEPRGKAGAYAIQGGAELFVARMAGSHSGVIGLPLQQTAALLRSFGLRPQLFAPMTTRRDPDMSEEILINVTPRETRVAVVENGMLQELHIERGWRRGVVGNIYKGKVQRVMPGMQAAFVDIGLERAAFLHANDVMRPPQTGNDGEGGGDSLFPSTAPTLPVTELLRDGQDIVVQVVKDPIGSKGARLTTQISIPSRYLVLLPQSRVVGVSARIEDDAERTRLKTLVSELAAATGGHGYIVRTNAEGQSADALAEDIAYLQRAWALIEHATGDSRLGARLYEDLTLPMRAVRDLMRRDVDKVKVDSRDTYEKLCIFAAQYLPAPGPAEQARLVDRIECYAGTRPIFDLYGVEDEIQRALKKDVPLKSGGYLVIDQTEAMTTVDVNTGSFLGQRNLEETVFRTNLEAAQAVARQLRLRNLGGIIIIDFIDMVDPEHKRQVMRTLEKSLSKDHAKTTVYDFSPLGLVEMTRKRTVESLERQLGEACTACGGRGIVKTVETVTYEIFREIVRAVRQFEADRLLVIASPKVVSTITDEESAAVVELEEFLGKSIRFQSDDQYLQEQFDVVLL